MNVYSVKAKKKRTNDDTKDMCRLQTWYYIKQLFSPHKSTKIILGIRSVHHYIYVNNNRIVIISRWCSGCNFQQLIGITASYNPGPNKTPHKSIFFPSKPIRLSLCTYRQFYIWIVLHRRVFSIWLLSAQIMDRLGLNVEIICFFFFSLQKNTF